MVVVPAVDLLGGDTVQLVQGDPARTRLRLPDPVETASRWVRQGAPRLHVVDLDGALETGGNQTALSAILATSTVPVQVGGGIRDGERIAALLEAGADRVIVGTRAIEDLGWLRAASLASPGRLVVAADTRDGRVLTHGWRRAVDMTPADLIDLVADLPLAAILITDVNREGMRTGSDGALFARLAASCARPLIAAGGIRALEDLRELEAAGVAEAVVGTALYTGDITPQQLLEEFWDERSTT